MRDAEESDLAVRERGGGEGTELWGRLRCVVDAVGRRRGNEVKGAQSDERSGFRSGGAQPGKEINKSGGARGAAWVRLSDLWMTARAQDHSQSK